jgi:hypothetical protein
MHIMSLTDSGRHIRLQPQPLPAALPAVAGPLEQLQQLQQLQQLHSIQNLHRAAAGLPPLPLPPLPRPPALGGAVFDNLALLYYIIQSAHATASHISRFFF